MELMPHLKLPDNLGVRYAILKGLPKKLTVFGVFIGISLNVLNMLLAILHDMDFVAENFERVIVMAHGQVLADGTREEVFAQEEVLKKARIEQPYMTRLCSLLRTVRKALPDTAWVLTGSTCKPAEPRNFRRSIRGYLLRAQVPPVHPHALRHTFATLCLQAGCDIKTLSELLGHSSAAVTLQRYVHTSLNQKRLEMKRVFSVCFAPKGSSKGASRTQAPHFSCVLSN